MPLSCSQEEALERERDSVRDSVGQRYSGADVGADDGADSDGSEQDFDDLLRYGLRA